jgi:hypothetical protein
MKLITLILITTLMAISGFAEKGFVGTVQPPDGSYIIFKDGKRLDGNWPVLKDQEAFTEKTIGIDGITYKTEDIKMYSDGENVYVNIGTDDRGKRTFAVKVFGEKMKLYRAIYKQVGVIGKSGKWALMIVDLYEYADGKYTPIKDFWGMRKKWPKDFNHKHMNYRNFYEAVEEYNTGNGKTIREVKYSN